MSAYVRPPGTVLWRGSFWDAHRHLRVIQRTYHKYRILIMLNPLIRSAGKRLRRGGSVPCLSKPGMLASVRTGIDIIHAIILPARKHIAAPSPGKRTPA